MQIDKLGLAVFSTPWLKMVPPESPLTKISTEPLFTLYIAITHCLVCIFMFQVL